MAATYTHTTTVINTIVKNNSKVEAKKPEIHKDYENTGRPITLICMRTRLLCIHWRHRMA